MPEPRLKDFPALAAHAGVIAVRRPASLLLPATAALFCARCTAQAATAALRLAESDKLNAWAGASSPRAVTLLVVSVFGEKRNFDMRTRKCR